MILVIYHFGFEAGTLVLIALVPGHCLSFPVYRPNIVYSFPFISFVTIFYPMIFDSYEVDILDNLVVVHELEFAIKSDLCFLYEVLVAIKTREAFLDSQ